MFYEWTSKKRDFSESGHPYTTWSKFWIFLTPLRLLYKAYVTIWSFGWPPLPLNCPRGLWMTPYRICTKITEFCNYGFFWKPSPLPHILNSWNSPLEVCMLINYTMAMVNINKLIRLFGTRMTTNLNKNQTF